MRRELQQRAVRLELNVGRVDKEIINQPGMSSEEHDALNASIANCLQLLL
jgi:hypothetical protein